MEADRRREPWYGRPRYLFSILAVLLIIGVAVAAASGDPRGTSTNASDIPPAWSTTDMDITTNGNIATANKWIAAYGFSPSIQRVSNGPLSLAAIVKAPFRYIGVPYQFQGIVAIAQDYPAVNGVSYGELVMTDPFLTTAEPIDAIVLGGTGSAVERSAVIINAYIVGTETVTNRLGGQTEQLVIVGAFAPKPAGATH